MNLDEIKVAMGGTATWVMPIGRDYSQYGEECTPEEREENFIKFFFF